MTLKLMEHGDILGIEAEDMGFICFDCLTVSEQNLMDSFKKGDIRQKPYECTRCKKEVISDPTEEHRW